MKKYFKISAAVIFLCLVIYLLKFSPLSYYLFTDEGKQIFGERFSSYLNALGAWGPFLFIGVYALAVMLFIPASLFTAIGGMIFGNWLGLLLNVTAAMLGGTVSFYMSRYLLRGAAEKILQSGHFKKLDDKAVEHGFSIMLYLRLMFVPFTYLNFAVGLSKITFRDFFWGTLAGVVPGLAVVTFMANAVKTLLKTYKGPMDLVRPDIILPVLLFILSFFIPAIIKHFKKMFNVTKEIEEETQIENKE